MSPTKSTITVLFFLLFYVLIEAFKRKFKINSEITRKFAHLFSGVFAVLFSYFLNASEFIFIGLIFFGFFLVAHFNKFLESINLSHRKTYGEIVYPLGLIVLALGLYQTKSLFIVGILILAIPDTIAGYIGFKLGKKSKSFAGSLAYFLTSLVILVSILEPINSILFASTLSLVEFVSPLGLDNLSVPIVYCLLVLAFQI